MARLCHDFGKRNRLLFDIVSFTNGEAFLDAMKQERFSIVFMDIYMQEMSEIAAALKMRERDNVRILIFLTSSTDFMPDAFSCHAFEYIVKPLTEERVHKVLTDALNVLHPHPRYMEIISRHRTIPVYFRDVLSVVTDAHYLNIRLMDGSVLRSRMTMPALLRLTEGDPRFILINKGILINADHVQNFQDSCCVLKDGARLPMRVRDRGKIKQAIWDYCAGKI